MGKSHRSNNKSRRAAFARQRRVVLQGIFAVAVLTPLGLTRAAAQADLTVSRLPGGLKLISGAGANVVCGAGPEGAFMVDGGLAATANQLVDRVLTETRTRRVATLFNTCWRLQHTGANDLLGAAGTRIIAHENTRLWMSTQIDSRWEKTVYPPRAVQARPNRTFYTQESLAVGPERIDYGYLLQAHTDGDAYVFFRKANVVAVGGAVAGRGWPVIDTATGGWIGGHVRGLETLIKLVDDKTVIVPADGPLLTKTDLVSLHAQFVDIMSKLQALLESGYGLAEVLNARPLKEYEVERGDPTQFVTLAFRSFRTNLRQFRAV